MHPRGRPGGRPGRRRRRHHRRHAAPRGRLARRHLLPPSPGSTAVVGAEEYGKGASANLGPTVNIDRDPRWGRSFESLSEDPYLTSTLGVAEIDGVQCQDVMSRSSTTTRTTRRLTATPRRTTRSSSDRALQEIYIPPFTAAVTQAHVASVMCAYSYVNGNASCNSSYLHTDACSSSWRLPGLRHVGLWRAARHRGALDGTDQEQPVNTYYGAPLETDLEDGMIPVSALNTMVRAVLTEMFQFNLFSHPRTGTHGDTVTTPAHVALANKVAEAGTTLLKNDGGTLPLSQSEHGRGDRPVGVRLADLRRRRQRVRDPVLDRLARSPGSRRPTRTRPTPRGCRLTRRWRRSRRLTSPPPTRPRRSAAATRAR